MGMEDVMKAIEWITNRGNSAEVKRNTDGTFTVYEVKKNKVTCAK